MENKKLERKLVNLQKQLLRIQSQIERLEAIEESIEDNIYMLESELTQTLPNQNSDSEN